MFPDLFAHNPASHAIWWVAGGIVGVLALILVVEVADWLGAGLRRLLGLAAPAPTEPGDDRFLVREPDSELRRRHFRRTEAERRTWSEHRPNDPT